MVDPAALRRNELRLSTGGTPAGRSRYREAVSKGESHHDAEEGTYLLLLRDYLTEERILEETNTTAVKRVLTVAGRRARLGGDRWGRPLFPAMAHLLAGSNEKGCPSKRGNFTSKMAPRLRSGPRALLRTWWIVTANRILPNHSDLPQFSEEVGTGLHFPAMNRIDHSRETVECGLVGREQSTAIEGGNATHVIIGIVLIRLTGFKLVP